MIRLLCQVLFFVVHVFVVFLLLSFLFALFLCVFLSVYRMKCVPWVNRKWRWKWHIYLPKGKTLCVCVWMGLIYLSMYRAQVNIIPMLLHMLNFVKYVWKPSLSFVSVLSGICIRLKCLGPFWCHFSTIFLLFKQCWMKFMLLTTEMKNEPTNTVADRENIVQK